MTRNRYRLLSGKHGMASVDNDGSRRNVIYSTGDTMLLTVAAANKFGNRLEYLGKENVSIDEVEEEDKEEIYLNQSWQEVVKVVSDCDNPDSLATALGFEESNRDRKSVINAINERLEELE